MAPITHTDTHRAHCTLPTFRHPHTDTLHWMSWRRKFIVKIPRRYAIDLPWLTRCILEGANEWAQVRLSCSHVRKKWRQTCCDSLTLQISKKVYVLCTTFLTDISYRKNQIMILINRFSAKLSVYVLHIFILWFQADVIPSQHMMWVWHLKVATV